MKYNLMENALGAANWMKWDNDVVANNEAEQRWKWTSQERKRGTQTERERQRQRKIAMKTS